MKKDFLSKVTEVSKSEIKKALQSIDFKLIKEDTIKKQKTKHLLNTQTYNS